MAGGDGSDSEKLDEIKAILQGLNTRLHSMDMSIAKQSEKIERLEERGNIANEFFRLQLGVTKDSTFDRNMLIGESGKRTRSASLEELQKKKAKQRLGARLYAAYLVVYGALMVVSMLDLIPVFEWEVNQFEWHNGLANDLRASMYVPFALSFLYLVVIFGIQRVMKNREPFNLRNELALWSLGLGLFSLFGSLRTVPILLKGLMRHGLQHMVCADTREVWFYTPAGFWTGIFILSKVPELIDTLFIVLRKRKLITLHWYHHITVMTFCWHSWATLSLNGLFFSALNLSVHAFMYIFYSLTALGYRPTFFAQFITLAQIAQMVVGTAISCYVVFYRIVIDKDIDIDNMSHPNFDITVLKDDTPGCKINGVNAMAGMVMYGSYLWLFCVFYYYAYILPKPKSSRGSKSRDKVSNKDKDA